MLNLSSTEQSVIKVNGEEILVGFDSLAAEEPLEIRIEHGPANSRQIKNVSVTMRTPGNDFELALGFLFTEGIVSGAADVTNVEHVIEYCKEGKQNVVLVKLNPGISLNLQNTERNFYTTSSCGVCGKASIDAIRTVSVGKIVEDNLILEPGYLHNLPEILRRNQSVFDITGALHASAIFDLDGNLILIREDVGRHNALDKLIGAAIQSNLLPLNSYILLLSGRISFELVQKAAMAGLKVVAAIGAPSTLAVELAKEFDLTLIGFLRGQSFNIYSGEHRLKI